MTDNSFTNTVGAPVSRYTHWPAALGACLNIVNTPNRRAFWLLDGTISH